MHTVGDKNQFAIEWQCECIVHESRWYPTELCFGIGGKQLGNFEETLQMYCYITRLEDFLLYEEIRYHPFLFNRIKEDIFNHVYQRATQSVTVSEKEKDEIECLDMEPFDQYFLEEEYERWLRCVFIIGDMFFPGLRDYDIMVINEPFNQMQRIIWLDKSQSRFTLHEHILPIGYFERVAWEFLNKSIEYLRDNGFDIDYLDVERGEGVYGKFRMQKK